LADIFDEIAGNTSAAPAAPQGGGDIFDRIAAGEVSLDWAPTQNPIGWGEAAKYVGLGALEMGAKGIDTLATLNPFQTSGTWGNRTTTAQDAISSMFGKRSDMGIELIPATHAPTPAGGGSLLPNLWAGLKETPRAAVDLVGSISPALDALSYLPMDTANAGTDAKNLAISSMFGTAMPASNTNYERLEGTLRGIGDTAALTAGFLTGGPVGAAAATTGYDWLKQATGLAPETTAEEDYYNLTKNVGLYTGLQQAGKVVEGVAKAPEWIDKNADRIANALDRKSLGTRQSDYGTASSTPTINSLDGIETQTKAKLDSLLREGKLGTSRDPAVMLDIISKRTKDLNTVIDTTIQNYDAVNPITRERFNPPVRPTYENAEAYLRKGKVPADEVPLYRERISKYDLALETEGRGSLAYLQEQKKALGMDYDPTRAVKAGFDRALYADLQTAIEKVAPTVKLLNQELSNYVVAEPIVKRSLAAAENQSFLSKARDYGFTTGGLMGSTVAGGVAGGPIGAAAGLTSAVAARMAASPRGQATIARGIRSAGRGARALNSINDVFTPKGGGGPGGGISSVFGAPPESAPPGGAIQQLFAPAQAAEAAGLKAPLLSQESAGLAKVEGSGATLRPSQTTGSGSALLPSSENASMLPSLKKTENLAPSYKYSPSTSAKEVLSDSGFISHYNNTTKQYPQLQKILKDVAGDLPIKSGIKEMETAAGKVVRKLPEKPGYTEESLGDLIRGQIFAKTNAEAIALVEKVRSKAEIVGKVEDYISQPNPWGYQGVNLNIKTPGGALAEVQLHTPMSIAIQEAIHPIYEAYRSMKKVPQEALDASRILAGRAMKKVQENELLKDSSVEELVNKYFKGDKKPVTKEAESAAPKKTIGEVLLDPKKTDVKAVEQLIDADPYYSTLYEVESGRNPSAKNPESSASGGFQFIKSTAKSVGLKDPFDLAESFEAVKKLTEQHKALFGDDPATLYAAHYLGSPLLSKVLKGERITEAQAAQVETLKQVLQKRFNPILKTKFSVEV
jgi:ppGpp synthetase/RelA/SpoT-type nucleotidyltranferase